MGFDITHVDVGGGLGVDYDGSRSTRPASVNYSMREYANDVVYTLGGGLPDRGPADAAPDLGVGPGAHRAPLAAADQRDRRRVADRAGGAARSEKDAHPLLVEMAENLDGLSAGPGRGGVPRRRLRQGAGPGVLRQRRVLPPRARPTPTSSTWSTLNALSAAMGDDRGGVSPRSSTHIDADAGGPLLLQLLGVPVAAGQLGDRPALPDHADPPAATRRRPGGARCRT